MTRQELLEVGERRPGDATSSSLGDVSPASKPGGAPEVGERRPGDPTAASPGDATLGASTAPRQASLKPPGVMLHTGIAPGGVAHPHQLPGAPLMSASLQASTPAPRATPPQPPEQMPEGDAHSASRPASQQRQPTRLCRAAGRCPAGKACRCALEVERDGRGREARTSQRVPVEIAGQAPRWCGLEPLDGRLEEMPGWEAWETLRQVQREPLRWMLREMLDQVALEALCGCVKSHRRA